VHGPSARGVLDSAVGPHAKVLEPSYLAAMVVDEMKRALQLYDR
jgi:predicted DNA-binding transcriptional regulator YafY